MVKQVAKNRIFMRNLELREEYQLSRIIQIVKEDIQKNGLTYEDFCLYAKDEDVKYSDLICYLERNPTISDDDEEIYPEFVINNSLELFFNGQQFEDVIMNVLHQKKDATIDDYIKSLEYYTKNDTFLDFE